MRINATRNAPAEWQAATALDPAAWIPLSELALEGFGYANTVDDRVRNLRHDLADEVLLDDIGRACVPRSVARQLFTDRAQKQHDEQARAAAARAEAKAKGHPLRDRVRALQQRETLGDPLADMKQDEYESDWEKAAAKRAEIAANDQTGTITYHPIRQEQ